MPVSQTCNANLQSAFNLGWSQKGKKYLGILLNPNVNEIMMDNMEKLLPKITENLYNWSKLHLTLWGKVNTIKMAVAPLINYYTGMMLICIPPQILKRYDILKKKFLGIAQIKLIKLCQPKKRGLSIPNIEHYSISFEMSKLCKPWTETKIGPRLGFD